MGCLHACNGCRFVLGIAVRHKRGFVFAVVFCKIVLCNGYDIDTHLCKLIFVISVKLSRTAVRNSHKALPCADYMLGLLRTLLGVFVEGHAPPVQRIGINAVIIEIGVLVGILLQVKQITVRSFAAIPFDSEVLQHVLIIADRHHVIGVVGGSGKVTRRSNVVLKTRRDIHLIGYTLPVVIGIHKRRPSRLRLSACLAQKLDADSVFGHFLLFGFACHIESTHREEQANHSQYSCKLFHSILLHETLHFANI